MATVTVTLRLLYRDTVPEPNRRPMSLIPVTFVAIYMLLLAPLPDAISTASGLHFLLSPHL
jgi:hypothetical protein